MLDFGFAVKPGKGVPPLVGFASLKVALSISISSELHSAPQSLTDSTLNYLKDQTPVHYYPV